MTPISIFDKTSSYKSSLYTNTNSHKMDLNIKLTQSWVYHFHLQQDNDIESSPSYDFRNMVPFIYSILIFKLLIQNKLNECKYSNSILMLLFSETCIKAQKTTAFLCDNKYHSLSKYLAIKSI